VVARLTVGQHWDSQH